MLLIAVDRDLGSIYEGAPTYGQEVRPTPVTAPAAIISEEIRDYSGLLPAANALEAARMLFREDSFDPVTRIRRGRLYASTQSGPETWRVPHPSGVIAPRPVYPFRALWTPQALADATRTGGRPLVLIGTGASFTIWSITSVEGTVLSEFLLTLRGRLTFGALPALVTDLIPEAWRGGIVEAVTKLNDEVFRAGPGSVVDRARDVASAALSAYLQNIKVVPPGRELDELVKKLGGLEGEQRKRLATAAAEIVRLLHSHEKPSVRERLPVSAVREQEAELAVSCVGALLVELGWASWS